jgi:hypothetical protein
MPAILDRRAAFASVLANYHNSFANATNEHRHSPEFVKAVLKEGKAGAVAALKTDPRLTSTDFGAVAAGIARTVMTNESAKRAFIDIEIGEGAYIVSFDENVQRETAANVLAASGAVAPLCRPGDKIGEGIVSDLLIFAVEPTAQIAESFVKAEKTRLDEGQTTEAHVGKIDKAVWKKAEDRAVEQYGAAKREKNPDSFYAITMSIYKKMSGVKESADPLLPVTTHDDTSTLPADAKFVDATVSHEHAVQIAHDMRTAKRPSLSGIWGHGADAEAHVVRPAPRGKEDGKDSHYHRLFIVPAKKVSESDGVAPMAPAADPAVSESNPDEEVVDAAGAVYKYLYGEKAYDAFLCETMVIIRHHCNHTQREIEGAHDALAKKADTSGGHHLLIGTKSIFKFNDKDAAHKFHSDAKAKGHAATVHESKSTAALAHMLKVFGGSAAPMKERLPASFDKVVTAARRINEGASTNDTLRDAAMALNECADLAKLAMATVLNNGVSVADVTKVEAVIAESDDARAAVLLSVAKHALMAEGITPVEVQPSLDKLIAFIHKAVAK